MSAMDKLANIETLRRKLAAAAGVTEDFIDLIEIPERVWLCVRWWQRKVFL
ncbi:MAG: hypothetical protein L3J65_05105 [Robiginitomaculum sp.]|nr:hypothetical protein [Robiginitomaculum sp.]